MNGVFKEQASRLAAERRVQPDDSDRSRAKSRRLARRSTRSPVPGKSKVIKTKKTGTSASRRTQEGDLMEPKIEALQLLRLHPARLLHPHRESAVDAEVIA
jgi:hypothetical protein